MAQAGREDILLSIGYVYEQSSGMRAAPELCPSLVEEAPSEPEEDAFRQEEKKAVAQPEEEVSGTSQAEPSESSEESASPESLSGETDGAQKALPWMLTAGGLALLGFCLGLWQLLTKGRRSAR